ncbi:hypothetical protein Cgig2_015300 [Carnegiea gigantea]|uniref:Uncharacterized protein n=1 Tax=Carnegiea gigantea TaxID=171969 RepID=A0A9Q1Q537_9CARY|nr:hypothetical protein Cgig2_015300 [Carnegiea gigantea]
MTQSSMLHPKKDPIYRLQPPSPEEINEWEYSVVRQFADTRHFSLDEVRGAVNLFWRSRGYITVRKKDHYRRHCFSNCIRAFSKTPDYLTSRVDILEPGSSDYGSVPVHGYEEGPSEEDDSSNSSEEEPRHCFTYGYEYGAYTMRGVGPIRPTRAPSSDSSCSNFFMPQNEIFGHNMHRHPTTFPTQGPVVEHIDCCHAGNPYLRTLGACQILLIQIMQQANPYVYQAVEQG